LPVKAIAGIGAGTCVVALVMALVAVIIVLGAGARDEMAVLP